MTTFTTEDRESSEDLIKKLQERIVFLEAKNKWLMEQIQNLEVKIWGSR